MSFSPRQDLSGDEDGSLFGSPPPSPGRSPSPALALPGTRNAVSSVITKNVGTIALPGSQANSELLNPLASSLSLPHTRFNPPAPSVASSGSSTPSTPAASSTTLPKPPRVRKRKKKSTPETTPRPELQIPLPDPTAPPPANFLRSQTALLGAAGLVAGVKPANLVHRARGTTPSNPIVIGEEPPKPVFRPMLHKQHPLSGPSAVENILDKPGLSMPSKQEILAQLVKEKDIFPIIQSLIKLTAPGSTVSPPPPPQRSSRWGQEGLEEDNSKRAPRTEVIGTHATGFPMKKRKLNRVPAGAADWDIPYPFARGEGPEEYQENWRTERGKQLITQLLNLIQSATKKAAMQNYLRRNGRRESRTNKGKSKEGAPVRRRYDEPKVNKYYKAITATYGLSPSNPSSRQSTPAAESNSRSVTPSTVSAPTPSSAATTPGPEQAQQSESLDQLLSSIFAMTNTPQSSQEPSTASPTNASADAWDFGMDQAWLDDWMKTLDPNSPMDLDGICGLPPIHPSASAPPMDFDFSSFDFADLNNIPPAATNSNQPFDMPANLNDFQIDPNLLGLGPLPALDGSLPMPDVSSTAMPTANTAPASAEWDVSSMMDIFGPELSAGNGESSRGGMDIASIGSAQGGFDESMWDVTAGKAEQASEAGNLSEGMKDVGVEEGVVDAHAQQQQFTLPDSPAMGEVRTVTPVQELLLGDVPPASALENAQSAQVQEPAQEAVSPPPAVATAAQDSSIARTPLQESPQANLSSQGFAPDASVVEMATCVSTTPTITAAEPPTTTPASSAEPSTSRPLTVASAPSAVPSTVPEHTAVASTENPSPASQKEDLIRRVKERKTLLELELNKVKLQLWETTIEQGALHHVLGHYQEKEKTQKESVLGEIENSALP